jgi:hypothetical protein
MFSFVGGDSETMLLGSTGAATTKPVLLVE